MESEPRKMWVRSVGQSGNQLGEVRQVTLPETEQVPAEGLAHVGEYVSRLLGSEAAFASLIIATLDRQRGFLVWRRGGEITVSTHVDWRMDPQREQAIRQFFSSRGLAPTQDYLAGNGGVPDATRCLSYPCGSDARQIADVYRSLLSEVFGVAEAEGLGFCYQERQ